MKKQLIVYAITFFFIISLIPASTATAASAAVTELTVDYTPSTAVMSVRGKALGGNGTQVIVRVNDPNNVLVYFGQVTSTTDSSFSQEFKILEPIKGNYNLALLADGNMSTATVQVDLGGEVLPTPTTPSASNQTPAPDDLPQDIKVNGKSYSGLATIKTTNQTGGTTKVITIDPLVLERSLKEGDGQRIYSILVGGSANAVTSELNIKMLKDMAGKQVVLEINTDNVIYSIPTYQINIDSILEKIGISAELKDIKVELKIAKPTVEIEKIISNLDIKEIKIVAPLVNFSIECSYLNKKLEVDRFLSYVEKMIAIPDGINPKSVTTGIVIETDGNLRHIPTKIVNINGKNYASMKSLTNSTYTIIASDKTFKDVDTHWAKSYINDMSSRLIISGADKDNFEPNKSITRAEFAAIIVKALGLKSNPSTKSEFADIKTNTWYYEYVCTAKEYGLISGYSVNAFMPNKAITREEAMTIIYKAMKLTKLETGLNNQSILEKYSDKEIISNWAKDSVAACVNTNIVTGTSSGIIAPKNNITRAEAATIISGLLRKSALI